MSRGGARAGSGPKKKIDEATSREILRQCERLKGLFLKRRQNRLEAQYKRDFEAAPCVDELYQRLKQLNIQERREYSAAVSRIRADSAEDIQRPETAIEQLAEDMVSMLDEKSQKVGRSYGGYHQVKPANPYRLMTKIYELVACRINKKLGLSWLA